MRRLYIGHQISSAIFRSTLGQSQTRHCCTPGSSSGSSIFEEEATIKYVKPSRTALNARKKPTRLLPTPAPSIIVSQVPSRSLHGSPNGINSGSIRDLRGLHTSHDSGTKFCELTRPTEKLASRDQFLPDLDPHVSGVIQRHAGLFVPPQDHCRHSIDTAVDVRDRNNKGRWETNCYHCRGTAPYLFACTRHTGDDPFRGKDNVITVQNSKSQDMFELMKREIPKPFFFLQGQNTTSKRVSDVVGPHEAAHSRLYDHEPEPTMVPWKRYASDTEHTHVAGPATQKVDDLDIDFALLGDPNADE